MPKSKPTMTIKAALAMLTGPRSISNPDLECLGEGDLLALQTLLADHARLTRLLADLHGTARDIVDAAGDLKGETPRTMTDDDAETVEHVVDLAEYIARLAK